MNRNSSKRWLAFFLIANFIFCNTPESVLHALFADHKDQKIDCHVDPSITHFDVSVIDCHCNSNVVNIPYLQADVPAVGTPVFEYFHYHDASVAAPVIKESFYFSLRAPPFLS